MYLFLLKRLSAFIVTICIIMVTAFFLLQLMPGDRVRLQKSGYAIPHMTSTRLHQEYLNEYYRKGLHLPSFYISVSSLAVPDSFYRLPDKKFRLELIRLSQQTGNPINAYQQLSNRVSGNSEEDVSEWKKFIPVISFHSDNQFHRWLFGHAENQGVLRGDFGISAYSGRSVWSELVGPMKITAGIAILSLLISTVVSVLLALWLSNRNKFLRMNIVSPLFLVLYSLPVFWLGTWLLYLFANPYGLQFFPASGFYGERTESWMYYLWLLLPIFCNAFSGILFLTRLLSEGFREEDKQDYTRTALSKGASEKQLRKRHQLKNILFPAIAVIAGTFPVMMNGSILVEQIFSIPGLGTLMIRAVQTRDVELLCGFFLVTGILTVIVFQVIDFAGRVLDPRVRVSNSDAQTAEL